MKKVATAVFLLLVLSAVSYAQSGYPASKAATEVAELILIPYGPGVSGDSTTAGPWVDILTTQLKTSQQKDLFMGVSLVTGLYTETLVRSKNGVEDTSSATAGIEVRVLVDKGTAGERTAYPGIVDYDKRKQEMAAKFGGIIYSCTDANADGTIVFPTECVITEEELKLVLETLGSHHFNFVLDDLGSGVHKVQVQARINLASSVQAGGAKANALVGKGSLTVEEVRLVKGADIVLP